MEEPAQSAFGSYQEASVCGHAGASYSSGPGNPMTPPTPGSLEGSGHQGELATTAVPPGSASGQLTISVSLFCPGEAPRHGQIHIGCHTTVGDVRRYLRDVLGVPVERQKWLSLQHLRNQLGHQCEAVMLLDNSRTLSSYGEVGEGTELHAAAAPGRSADGVRGPRMQPGVPWGNAAPACPVMVLLPSGKVTALQRLSVDSYEMVDDAMCDKAAAVHPGFDGEVTAVPQPTRPPNGFTRDGRPVELTVASSYCY